MLRIEASNLADRPGIAHGFFGRTGGVSTGIYASLNCGPGSRDDGTSVAQNRCLALAALSPDSTRLVTLYQVHGATAVTVQEPCEPETSPRADAMATNVRGIALGILTADCAPVLLADAEARVIGAAHAGWKGAVAGVAESVIGEMEKFGARAANIAAAVGPCISRSAYEVGADMREQVMTADPANAAFFGSADRAGHWHFDLPGYVRSRIAAAGVRNVRDLALCTYAQDAAFFSYRRAIHRGEPDYGRQLSAILLL